MGLLWVVGWVVHGVGVVLDVGVVQGDNWVLENQSVAGKSVPARKLMVNTVPKNVNRGREDLGMFWLPRTSSTYQVRGNAKTTRSRGHY